MVDFERARTGRGRRAAWTITILLLALFFVLLPAPYRAPVRDFLRQTVLRPFIALQSRLARARPGAAELAAMRAQRDSLYAILAAQAALVEENRSLRRALGIAERIGPGFIPARVLRVGLDGAESTFLVDIGADRGVAQESPVLSPDGLVGVVREVSGSTAQVIDWTHSEFRASAMTDDGSVFGMIEPRAGRFREENVLRFTPGSSYAEIAQESRILTSGWGDLYPRGIPIGTVIGVEDDTGAGWRKSYIVSPAARLEGLRQVFVGIGGSASRDLTAVWMPPPPGDPTLPPLRADSVRRPIADSARVSGEA